MTSAVRVAEIVLACMLAFAVARVMWDNRQRMTRWHLQRFLGLWLFTVAIIRSSVVRFDVPPDYWTVAPILVALAVSLDGTWAMRSGRDRLRNDRRQPGSGR